MDFEIAFISVDVGDAVRSRLINAIIIRLSPSLGSAKLINFCFPYQIKSVKPQ